MASNAQIARNFVAAITEKGLDGIFEYLTDDFTWYVQGLGEIRDKLPAIGEVFANNFAGPISMVVHGTTSEDDRVAVQVESNIPLKSGRTYNNHYCMVMVFENNKIKRIREYHDTLHAKDVLSGLFK